MPFVEKKFSCIPFSETFCVLKCYLEIDLSKICILIRFYYVRPKIIFDNGALEARKCIKITTITNASRYGVNTRLPSFALIIAYSQSKMHRVYNLLLFMYINVNIYVYIYI